MTEQVNGCQVETVPFCGTIKNATFTRLIETYVIVGELVEDANGAKVHPPIVVRCGQVRQYQEPTDRDCGHVLTMLGFYHVLNFSGKIPTNLHGERTSNGRKKQI